MLGLLGPAVGEGRLQDVRVVAELVLQLRGRLRPLTGVGCLLTGEHPGCGHGAVQLNEVGLPAQELSQERFQTAKHSGPILLVVFIVVRRNRNGHGQGVESTLGIACLERELDLGRTESAGREDQAQRHRLQVVEPEIVGVERPVPGRVAAGSGRGSGCRNRTRRSSSCHDQPFSGQR